MDQFSIFIGPIHDCIDPEIETTLFFGTLVTPSILKEMHLKPYSTIYQTKEESFIKPISDRAIFTNLVIAGVINHSNVFTVLDIFYKEKYYIYREDRIAGFLLLDGSILHFRETDDKMKSLIPGTNRITIYLIEDYYKKLLSLFVEGEE